MTTTKNTAIAVLATIMMIGFMPIAQADVITFDSEAAFLAATGSLAFESFETATSSSATQVDFTGGSFSCTGTSFCPGFFGISGAFAQDGSTSVFYASPDEATFTFDTAINTFGIFIGGAGDVANITLTALLSNGDSATVLDNYSGSFDVFGDNSQYFGIISDMLFTSITFSPNNSGDGIFFDSMSYGSTSTSVPEPGTLALLGIGLFGMGMARRRKSA